MHLSLSECDGGVSNKGLTDRLTSVLRQLREPVR